MEKLNNTGADAKFSLSDEIPVLPNDVILGKTFSSREQSSRASAIFIHAALGQKYNI